MFGTIMVSVLSMIKQKNEKLSFKRKTILLLGLLVAALILTFSQNTVIRAKPESDNNIQSVRKNNLSPDINDLKKNSKLNIDTTNSNGTNKKTEDYKIPVKNSNSHNRIFDSI